MPTPRIRRSNARSLSVRDKWALGIATQRMTPGGTSLPARAVARGIPKVKPVRIQRKRGPIKGGIPVPAGALGAAVAVARTAVPAVVRGLRGSPITGPTKLARISSAAAGPIAASTKRGRKPAAPRSRSRGSTARYQ